MRPALASLCLATIATVLTACAPGTTPPGASTAPGVTSTSGGTSVAASTSASAPTTPSPTPSANPNLPTLDGAIDVGITYSSFAIPSGKISCATNGTLAECTFPDGMKAGVPAAKDVCDTTRRFVVGVTVSSGKAKYMCLGSPSPNPASDGNQIKWHKSSYGWVKHNGAKLAVLPDKRKIASGNLVCESHKNYARCGNVATGRGFKLSIDGPVFY